MNTEADLTDAGLFVLGWLVAKEGYNSPAARILAFALKRAGVASTYIEEIIKLAKAKKRKASLVRVRGKKEK